MSAQTSYRKSEENLRDTRGMYKIAQQRHDIGTVTKSELLQLELSMMNAELTVSNSKVDLEVALFNFKSYLGVATADERAGSVHGIRFRVKQGVAKLFSQRVA